MTSGIGGSAWTERKSITPRSGDNTSKPVGLRERKQETRNKKQKTRNRIDANRLNVLENADTIP
jgi:hypothetical protein